MINQRSRGNIKLFEATDARKKAEVHPKHASGRIRRFSQSLQFIREEERTRISREIHDVLGQQLAVLKMELFFLNKKADSESVKKKTGDIIRSVDEIIQTVKNLAYDLHPAMLKDLGLAAAIQHECKAFENKTGIRCKLVSADEPDIHEPISTALFRVLQEALTNILRHSDASSVSVKLNRSGKNLHLEIKDNGKGITAEQVNRSGSLGLRGMKERMNSLGGSLSVTGQAGEGTIVTATVPAEIRTFK